MITAGVPRSERTYVGVMAAARRAAPARAGARRHPPRRSPRRSGTRRRARRTPFTYTALIDAQVKGGAPEEAFATYDQRDARRRRADGGDLRCLLNACRVALLEAKKKKGEGEKEAPAGASETASDASEALNSRAVSRAYDLLGEMTALGVCPNDRCQNALVRVVSEAGRVDDTLDAVKRLARGGVRFESATLEGVVRALCRAGYAERALRILSWMETRGHEPNAPTLRELARACAAEGQVTWAWSVYRRMRRPGTADRATASDLVGALCRAWRGGRERNRGAGEAEARSTRSERAARGVAEEGEGEHGAGDRRVPRGGAAAPKAGSTVLGPACHMLPGAAARAIEGDARPPREPRGRTRRARRWRSGRSRWRRQVAAETRARDL